MVTSGKGILSLTISDEQMLYDAYMPFLKNGGLFIPTTDDYQLGEEVFVLLSLMGEVDKIPISGHIAWITPKNAQGNQTAGIGVHFDEKDGSSVQVNTKINSYLAGKLQEEKSNYTM